jgi:CheY-like chemotaxis protein
VRLIIESGRSLLALINDLLDVSRIESGRMDLEIAPFDAHATLTQVVNLLQPEARNKNICLSLDYAVEAPRWFDSDSDRFRQIVVNLVSNSVRYTDQGSIAITVRWDGAEQWLRLEVSDSGRGIPGAKLPLLFTPFAEIDESQRRGAGGTGLGLSITKMLVERFGGMIEVQSEEGRGSTFCVQLPFRPVESPPRGEPQSAFTSDEARTLQGARILLVEDNIVNQRVGVGLLAHLGCQVEVAVNGEEGVKKALAGAFDVILMDCLMPIMDGFTATRVIRNKALHPRRTAIIALTASGMEDDRRRCLAADMDAVYLKPIQIETLAALIAKWLPAAVAGRAAR